MVSDQELVDKYGNFCKYMARQVVFPKSCLGEDNRGLLKQQDVEDFAQIAAIALIQLPQRYRGEPYYIRQVIVNKTLKAKRDRLRGKRTQAWYQAPSEEYFDTLEGRDGLADYTQVNHDARRMLEVLPKLAQAEQLVLEMHFGLNGCQESSIHHIAKKLGRGEHWVERRLARALKTLNSLLTAKPREQRV